MSTYKTDFYAWTQETAALLKQGRFNEVDMAALIEEIEDMGASKERELESRLMTLLMHLLKWQYQPTHQGFSWRQTIENQRERIKRRLKKTPSLKPKLIEITEDAYLDAIGEAAVETGLAKKTFPANFEQTGWSIEQVLDEAFYPES